MQSKQDIQAHGGRSSLKVLRMAQARARAPWKSGNLLFHTVKRAPHPMVWMYRARFAAMALRALSHAKHRDARRGSSLEVTHAGNSDLVCCVVSVFWSYLTILRLPLPAGNQVQIARARVTGAWRDACRDIGRDRKNHLFSAVVTRVTRNRRTLVCAHETSPAGRRTHLRARVGGSRHTCHMRHTPCAARVCGRRVPSRLPSRAFFPVTSSKRNRREEASAVRLVRLAVRHPVRLETQAGQGLCGMCGIKPSRARTRACAPRHARAGARLRAPHMPHIAHNVGVARLAAVRHAWRLPAHGAQVRSRARIPSLHVLEKMEEEESFAPRALPLEPCVLDGRYNERQGLWGAAFSIQGGGGARRSQRDLGAFL